MGGKGGMERRKGGLLIREGGTGREVVYL